eukprot:GHVN01022389.1.p1 GENE.GHVN01022389.1~~GHVN01022389.1.p1  ORF type:complete len:146 (+),score=15.29 GHVN01022389.1:1433-1870(+)
MAALRYFVFPVALMGGLVMGFLNCDGINSYCIGECGQASKYSYIVTRDDVADTGVADMCLMNGDYSLCPNMEALVIVSVNGTPVFSSLVSTLNHHASAFKASVGDEVTTRLKLIDGEESIMCIRHGSAEVILGVHVVAEPPPSMR